MITFFMDLFILLVGHVLADYPLQGDFLSRAKRRDGVPGVSWYQALAAHALIHGGMVWLCTGSVVLGLAETAAHAVIDYTKCAGRLTFNQDQELHVACKIVWLILLKTTLGGV